MKRCLLVGITSLLIVVFFGCKEISKLTQFDLPVSQEFTIPALPEVSSKRSLPDLSLRTNYQQTLEANGMSKDNVDAILLQAFTLAITAPTDGSFNFLKSIEVFVKVKGKPKKRIAWKNNISGKDDTTLVLEHDGTYDLKEYIFHDTPVLEVIVSTKKPVLQSINIKSSLLFLVDAKVLGL